MKKLILLLIYCLSLLGITDSVPRVYVYSHEPIVYSVKQWSELDTLQALAFDTKQEFADYYKPAIKYVACKTGYDEAFVYTYFMYETSSRGQYGNSFLWKKAFNPGGVKWHNGRFSKHYIKAGDDCDDPQTDVEEKCKFSKFPTLKEGLDNWIKLLQYPRYSSCRGISLAHTFKCFMDNKYHTSRRWKQRYFLAEQYVLYLED